MLAAIPSLTRNVHSQVSDWIGVSIMRGDILPGESLPSELTICDMMNVSRTVVREAIRTLNGKGLVESRETSDVDAYLVKLNQLRHAIEPQAAALAAQNASDEDVSRMRAGYEEMVAAPDAESFNRADVKFHESIYFATRNEFFWPIAQMFKIALRRPASSPRGSYPLDAHRGMLEAITTRNAEGARVAAGALLSRSAFDPAFA
jgi:DNA-binding FadR family transcriptional regulator